MSVYKLYAAGTGGTEDGIAQTDIQFDGVITSIYMTNAADLDADLEFCHAEISFISQNSIGVNDTRGSLMTLTDRAVGTPAGNTGMAASSGPMAVPVTAGERVWMHISATAGAVSAVSAYLYVDDKASETLRRRR